MPPRRRNPALGQLLTIGGRVPASTGALLVVMLVASVWAWQDRAVEGWTVLLPGRLLAGEVWRLVSWVFVQRGPFDLLFVGLMLWWLGPQLSYMWGERRFLLRTLGITVGASIVASLAALVWPAANAPHLGAWPTVNALIVAWALIFPDQQVRIWGVLPVTGRTMALLVVFGTVLYALAGGGAAGFAAFLPHFGAMAIAYVLSRGVGLDRWTRRIRRGMQEREARRRAKHLKVIRRNGEGDRPRWMN